MVGIKQFKISNNKVSYDIRVKRKISLIRGDSGTGKTTLYNIVRDYETSQLSIKLSGYTNVKSLYGSSYNIISDIQRLKEHILIIDEDKLLGVDRNKIDEAINNSDNWFILITRDKSPALAIAYDSIYKMGSDVTGKNHWLEPKYTFKNNSSILPEQIVCEDSGSGYKFFKLLAKNESDVTTAKDGNAAVVEFALNKYKENYKSTLVIADGAAFGEYIEELQIMQSNNYRIIAYLPESFEWLLLHSPLFIHNNDVMTVLNTPIKDIDFSGFRSSENYFENLITELTKGIGCKYSKDKLNPCYYKKCCFRGADCKYIVRDRNRNKIKPIIDCIPIDLSKVIDCDITFD